MIKVAKWFLNKNFSQNERYAINTCSGAKVERETDKAMYICFDTDFGTIKTWLPRIVVTIDDDVELSLKNIEVGADVEHKTFGRGVVIASENGICTVKFGKNTKRIISTALTVA